MMQYDNNNMDKNLKQLENQSLPDLSKMDEHWEQMKAVLIAVPQPGNVVNGFFHKTRFYFLGAAAAVVTAVVLYSIFLTGPSKEEKKVTKQQEQQIVLPAKDTTPQTIIPPVTDTQYNIYVTTDAPYTDTATVFIPQKQPAKDYSAELEAFFREVEKPSQQFVIDNRQDTVINGHGGTSLLIPAYTFKRGPVTIILKEFYSYRDIITNRLSTSSDGRQLVTGGMIHLSAIVDGKEVNIQPGKSIRWFIPDTSAEMKDMKLFTGVPAANGLNWTAQRESFDGGIPEVSTFSEVSSKLDTIGRARVDWMAQPQGFIDTYFISRVRVLDLRDEPYKTKSTKQGTIAYFRLSDNSTLEKEQLETILKEKYKYYDVKVVERSLITHGTNADGVGDSIWIDQRIAVRYRLPATDTVTTRSYLTRYIPAGAIMRKTFMNSLNKLANRFSVDLNTLGWINCDRFYRSFPIIDYAVNLKDTATNYYTMLVFDQIKSMMAGYISGNNVVFPRVPEGMTAKVVSVGIQNGKPVIATEDVRISKTPLSSLKFEETTPDEFKNKAGELDK